MTIIEVIAFFSKQFSDKWMINEDRKYYNGQCYETVLQIKEHKHSDDNILIGIAVSKNDKYTFDIDINNSRFTLNTKHDYSEDQFFLLETYISNIMCKIDIKNINKEIHRSFENFDKSAHVKSIIRDHRIDIGLDIMGEE